MKSLRQLRAEDGLTMLEISIATLILTVLTTLAMLTLANQQDNAREADAKTQIANASRVAKVVWTDKGESFPDELTLVQEMLKDYDGDYSLAAGDDFVDGEIQVERAGPNDVTLRTRSHTTDEAGYAVRMLGAGDELRVLRTTGADYVPKVNLAPNPSFEAGVAHTSSANCQRTQSTTRYRYGSASLRCEVNSGAAKPVVGSYGAADASPVASGQTYSLSAWVYSQAPGPRQMRLCLRQYSNGDGHVGDACSSTRSISPGSWQELTLTTTALPSAVKAGPLLDLHQEPTGNGETFFVDGLTLVEGQQTPYFDGDYPGGSWTGSRGESISSALAWETW